MAHDACQPAPSDSGLGHLDTKSISDFDRAKMAEARTLEVSSALEEKALALFAAEAEIHANGRKIRGLENTNNELMHLKQLVPELNNKLTKACVDAEAKGKRLDQQQTYITGILRDLLRAEEKLAIVQKQVKQWKRIAKESIKEQVAAEVSAPTLGKRKAAPSSNSEPTSKKPKNVRYTLCSNCYINNRKCDANPEACKQCIMRSQAQDCKRVKCKHFETGTCRNKKCTFAHEEDNFHHLMEFRKLKPNRAAGDEISAHNKENLDICESIMDGLDLFSDTFNLGEKKHSGKADGEDSDDADDGVNGVPV